MTTCSNKRKLTAIIRNFISAAMPDKAIMVSDKLCYPTSHRSIEPYWVKNYSMVGKPCFSVHQHSDNSFSIQFSNNFNHFTVNYTLDWHDSVHTAFRAYFTKDSAIGKGFSTATLSFLHELGHYYTRYDVPSNYEHNYELYKRMRDHRAEFMASPAEWNTKYYFSLPDEALATNWANEWLKDAEHRKIAKAFERQFFACLK